MMTARPTVKEQKRVVCDKGAIGLWVADVDSNTWLLVDVLPDVSSTYECRVVRTKAERKAYSLGRSFYEAEKNWNNQRWAFLHH